MLFYKKSMNSNPNNNIYNNNIPNNNIYNNNIPNNNIPNTSNYTKQNNDQISHNQISNNKNYIIEYKDEFREFCNTYTNYIKNIELPLIEKNNKYEAVLIEFRILPHLEFLIRNTILKLGEKWSHTIVCGNLNYNYIVNLCTKIHKNIKIIQLDYDNLNQYSYSILLATTFFWNLFKGEHILIYQEDSIIFKSNIDDFLKYDYVGAPWPKSQNDTKNCVGNGGLSLRKKQIMIDIINTNSILNISVNSSTKEYMNNAKLLICPEDVYFSKTMQDYNIGIVADWNIASEFSTETVLNNNSFGGHNFWLCDNNWKERIFKHNIIQFNIPAQVDKGFNEHRGGWDLIKQSLNDNKLYSKNNNYIFYDMLDIIFLFNKGDIIEKKWCGIFHCTPITPSYLDFINISNIFNNINFVKSLKNCLGIITLTSYLSNYFIESFKKINMNINVYTLKHPTITTNIPLFNYINFKYNNNKKIIQLGQQLRKVSSIYLLPEIQNYSKLWLTGTLQFNKMVTFLKYEMEMFNIDKSLINMHKTPMKYIQNFDEYDNLLTTNLVFMDLYDAAANNAVVECIVRNTPIIVNKIPAIVEYLGEDYPLYFNNLSEIPELLTEQNIFNAHQYLLNMNKEDLEIEYFNKKLITLLYNIFNKE
jgi:hypothetical protein